jgi:hypothetical protein
VPSGQSVQACSISKNVSDDATWYMDAISLHQYGSRPLHVDVGAIRRRLGKFAEIQSLRCQVSIFQLWVRSSPATRTQRSRALGVHKHTVQTYGKRHRRLPRAYGSVGNMSRVKGVQFRLSSAQINAWAQYPTVHFRVAVRMGYEYHFFDKMVGPEVEMLRSTGAPIMECYSGEEGFVRCLGGGVQRVGSG